MGKRSAQEWAQICEGIKAGIVVSGGKSNTYPSGVKAVGQIVQLTGDLSGLKIAEIGSGNGRIAMGLTEHDINIYKGVEIIAGCVDFCLDAFNSYPNYDFAHLDIYNPHYNPKGEIDPGQAIYPLCDRSYDLILMMSVVTHVPEPKVVEHVLSEAWRCLEDQGRLYITWIVGDERQGDHSKAVYKRTDIESFLKRWSWLGESKQDGQLHILVKKGQGRDPLA